MSATYDDAPAADTPETPNQAKPVHQVLPAEYRVLPAGYATSSLVDKDAFEVRVAWRGTNPETGLDRWAVTHMGSCLALDGTWDHEPQPSSRDDDWRAHYRFSREKALRLAQLVVDDVRINGRTFAQWDEHFASTEQEKNPA